MTPRDVSLAALMSLCWGLAFVATKIALESFTPLQLTGLRFLIACAPVAFVARPQASWLELVSIGATLFGAQFLLLFLAFTQGLPPGVASVTQQIQAMFTVLLTAVFLREFPTPRQWSGMTIAFAGLALVGWTAGTDLKPLGLALGLAAALSWATGNLLVKRLGKVQIFPLVVWASLVPPLPMLLASSLVETERPLAQAVARASWQSVGAVLHLGLLGTLAGYGIWGYLLRRYPAAVVAPVSLMAPCVGMTAAALLLGERFGALRLGGMGLILLGLATILLPVRRIQGMIALWAMRKERV